MNRTFLICSMLLLTVACGQTTVPPIIDPGAYPVGETLKRIPAVMPQAMVADAEIASAISQQTVPAVVMIVSDQNLATYLSSIGLTREQFLSSPKLKVFLKGHVLNQSITGNGSYTSASGQVWLVGGFTGDRPGSINNVAVLGCFQTSTDATAVQAGLVCFVARPLVDLN